LTLAVRFPVVSHVGIGPVKLFAEAAPIASYARFECTAAMLKTARLDWCGSANPGYSGY